MIFLSESTLFGVDEMTAACVPTNLEKITRIDVYDVLLDDLYATRDVTSEITEVIPNQWDFDTILHATYDDETTSAGNVHWSLETTSHILIKRKRNGDFKWTTIRVQEINDYDDFDIYGYDYTCGIDLYDFAVVPVASGSVEGIYSITQIDVNIDKLVIVDADNVYSTPLTDAFCDTTSIMPSTPVQTLHGKFPYIVRNTRANYEEVTVTATFLPDMCDGFPTDSAISRYTREFKAWLTNGKTKLLKNVNGDLWLGYITTPPTDSAETIYTYRKISFGLSETGLPDNEKDLWYAGIIDSNVTSVWWDPSVIEVKEPIAFIDEDEIYSAIPLRDIDRLFK